MMTIVNAIKNSSLHKLADCNMIAIYERLLRIYFNPISELLTRDWNAWVKTYLDSSVIGTKIRNWIAKPEKAIVGYSPIT